MRLNPKNLKCSDLQDIKYRELCSRLSRKRFDKNFYSNIAEYYFPELEKYFSPYKVKINKNGFTSDKNIDMLILNNLDDEDLSKVCVINKYVYSLCQNETFWTNRFINKYGKYYQDIESMKKFKGEMSWKEYYLWISDLINDRSPYYVSAQARKADRDDIIAILYEMKHVLTYPLTYVLDDSTLQTYVKHDLPDTDDKDINITEVRKVLDIPEEYKITKNEINMYKLANNYYSFDDIREHLIGPFILKLNTGETLEGNFGENGWEYYEGGFKYYNSSGKLMSEGFYVKNLKEGEEKIFYDDGSIKKIVKYKSGIKQEETTYLKNGEIIDHIIY